MREHRWPALPLAGVALGIALLSAPDRIEGPVLLPISPGHALSVLDAIALIPLAAGCLGLYAGLWRRRSRLSRVAVVAPGLTGIGVFAGGFGPGLLIASAFSAFFWWWAVGALLSGAALLAAVVAARD